MKLYNTETRTIEEFIPRNPQDVKLYTCGPTVYNFAHIGNLRSYIVEDVLKKALEYVGYKVTRAMNITDVGHLASDADEGEDKMVKTAEEQNKPILEIAKMYTEAFKEDFKRLNLEWPEIVVPATSCVDTYIEIIKKLISDGYAYLSNGNVYFDVTKLKSYYRLTNQSADELKTSVRENVQDDLGKKNLQDFVLWFTKSKFENHALKWDSPWGVGYPGWHIECSGISYKYLGEYLDIHCGGVDNKFPHHTNEIAQSESFIGHKWCSYWFHVEHLNTLDGKMSKSKGEMLTISALKNKGYEPEVYKFFCLQSHYRKALCFTYEGLDTAKTAYLKLVKRISKLNGEGQELQEDKMAEFDNNFKAALSNDLNTSMAVTVLFDVLKSDLNDASKLELIKRFDTVLGISLLGSKVEDGQAVDDGLVAFIEMKIQERANAKKAKDYALADKIRAELLEKGVLLTDTKDGTTYTINK